MTGIARKILIYAAIDGLVIQPLAQRQRQSPPAVKISFVDKSISPTEKDVDAVSPRFEAFGIIGLLTVASSSFLLSITRRKQVAQIFGHPIYVVTEIAITPLSSKPEADSSITQTQRALRRGTPNTDGTDDSDDSGEEESQDASMPKDDVDDDSQNVSEGVGSAEKSNSPHARKTSIAEDVIARKGGYGRFTKHWFSKEKWRVDQLRNLGLSTKESDSESDSMSRPGSSKDQNLSENTVETPGLTSSDILASSAQNVAASLLPKLLKTTQVLFGSSRSYYFSYDYDITRSLGSLPPASKDLPLHAQVDPLFFWNRSLVQPFINSHQEALVLPLMQGFVGQQCFVVSKSGEIASEAFEGKDSMEMEEMSPPVSPRGEALSFQAALANPAENRAFFLTLISRRSIKRAGLRYLRRGVDDDGNVANNVETEQILSDSSWANRAYSFLQIRGSIPIFFSQSPYSFKPVPQIQQSPEANFAAFQRHFRKLNEKYGKIAITSLVEKHGNEAIVGGEYERNLARLNETDVSRDKIDSRFWDFHAETKGMRFENVATLMDMLSNTLDDFGYTVENSGKVEQKQNGVLRTNCMDCLDRTNVVQSAAARRALEIQLRKEGIDLTIQGDTQWFNTLWADNGDAVSKQYASTAALKGDFTRTRKRNYKGALTDMGLSISRFYSGIVNDYFSQAAIDFLVGNVTSVVFEDFEANMMSEDPGVSVDKIREQAIDMSHKLVVEDDNEELIGGWALLFPREPNTIKSMPFSESVLLLTDAALYACRFDCNLEKVSSFERVELDHITNIKYGTYIISTLSASQANEARNVGLLITYEAGKDDVRRVNTRSLSTSREQSKVASTPGPSTNILSGLVSISAPQSTCILAGKALPSRSAVVGGDETPRLSEMDQIKSICEEIERTVLAGRVIEVGAERKSIVEEKDIISLADAKRSTSLIEQLGYSIKKLVWA